MKSIFKFLKTVRAVLWSFLGVRRGAGLQEDMASLTPFHIIGVGIVLCFVLVLSLMWFAHWMIKT